MAKIPRPNTFTGNHLGDMKLKFASGASLSPLFTPAYIPTLHGEEGGGPWYLFQEGDAHQVLHQIGQMRAFSAV